MKKIETPPRPKRKRGKILRADAPAEHQMTDEEIHKNYRDFLKRTAPRIYSQAARAYGFVSARPQDFSCLCRPSPIDGRPICCDERPACPFAGIHEYDDAAAEKEKKRKKRGSDTCSLMNRIVGRRKGG